ncbi:MAG: EAL domain-containing protein [Xanthobacteraceae bacterium]|nr:EAL domain-containing protein [Xanthobacteraceae bacterium]
MGKLLDKRWVGDQLVAVVGLLVAAAMAALLGVVILVAEQVDQTAIHREKELLRTTLSSLDSRIKSDLSGLTLDENWLRKPSEEHSKWLHRHFGGRLYQAGLYDLAFMLNGADQPIYSSIGGMLARNLTKFDLDQQLIGLAQTVRTHFNAATAIGDLLASAGEVVPPPAAVYRSEFVRIDNRPAIMAAVATQPMSTRYEGNSASGPVIAVVAFLDVHVIHEIEREMALTGLRIDSPGKAVNGEASLELTMGAGQAPAAIYWHASRPGTSILVRIAPALGVITLFFGFVTLVVLRRMRKSTQELAVSERRAVEMAYRDPLTGLANRLRLVETLREQIPTLAPGQKLALFFLDLDGFKDINDTLGHPVGDELLAMVGERLEGILGSKGMTVRFGGDEFAVLAPISKTAEIGQIAERIIDMVRQPVAAGEHVLHVGVTLGVSLAPDHGREPEELLRRADIALYKAKAEGRGGYRLFDPADEAVLQNRRAIERDVERAMWHDEFFTLYQPLYSADGERVEGVETLVRWQHPDRGMVPPADFIHVAEKSGLIVKLDEWVLRKACENANQWPDISVAVNMSPSNFRHSNLAERVKRVVEETGFDPRRLEIEITEGMLLNATEDVLFDLQELREFGIRFAIDDFGTGYSSLGYLGSFPIDKIKIDQSFVQNLGVKEDAAAIVECVARLGRALGLAVTAEGVETAAQHRFVRAAGCQQIQGYLLSKPLRPGEIAELLRKPLPERQRA